VSETRKLAAILVSDVVGYSRLTGADEDRILARLRTLRSDLIDPTIAVHHGRIISFWTARVRSELHGAFLIERKQWTDALF
jgi:class 3 adenylate cyclase